MEKELITFSNSIKMNELGFNEKTISFYEKNSKKEIYSHDLISVSLGMNLIKRPTYGQCFRFFRENYDIHSFISYFKDNANYEYGCQIIFKNKTLSKRFNNYDEAQEFCLNEIINYVITNGRDFKKEEGYLVC